MIIRRRLWASQGMERKCQLFITKSHFLRDTVVKQLELVDVSVSVVLGQHDWPARGSVVCLTWNQLVAHFNVSPTAGCIGFREFQRHIYPRLLGLSLLAACALLTTGIGMV